MRCSSIPGTMKGIIASIGGVKNVEIKYSEGLLALTFDDTKVAPSDIVRKVGAEMGIALEAWAPSDTNRGGNIAGTHSL